MVVFKDGKAMSGRLVGVGTYDLVVEINGDHFLIAKRAIKYVRPPQQS